MCSFLVDELFFPLLLFLKSTFFSPFYVSAAGDKFWSSLGRNSEETTSFGVCNGRSFTSVRVQMVRSTFYEM